MKIIESYIGYIRDVKRYSPRTVQIYADALNRYVQMTFATEDVSDAQILESLNRSEVRQHVVNLMELPEPLSPKTVRLHMSALSGFCRFLVKRDYLESNPVALVPKPKLERRLPSFYRSEAMERYFEDTKVYA